MNWHERRLESPQTVTEALQIARPRHKPFVARCPQYRQALSPRSAKQRHRDCSSSHSFGTQTSRLQCTAVANPSEVSTRDSNQSGEVLYVGAGMAVVDELDNDAPIGTKISFSNDSSGALMWRRDDNLCYILLLQGSPQEGDIATCCTLNKPRQGAEASEDQNQRDFEQAQVAVGGSRFGHSTNFLGKEGKDIFGGEEHLPLLNEQVTVENREQILEALPLGIKPVDILTPVGRGQAQLITGPAASGKTDLVLDAILGQKGSEVRCIYASVGASESESQRRWNYIQENGQSAETHMIVASAQASLGEKYAALCAACSCGEQIRDAGGHSLVILDDISSMAQIWEHITKVVQSLRPDSEGSAPDNEEDLVEYEGMLISAAAASRRRFFSLLVQRAAKMHRRNGGGSMTLLLVLSGKPATGILKKAPDVSKYKHLSPELRAKLEAKLAANLQQDSLSDADVEERARTELVEEFMSMADGQTVLREQPGNHDDAHKVLRVDASASVSRIGGRAYAPGLQELAKTARLDLVQAADAQAFSSDRSQAETAKAEKRAAQLAAALMHRPGQTTSVAQQVIMLFALQQSLFRDTVQQSEVQSTLDSFLHLVERDHDTIIQDLNKSAQLSDDQSLTLSECLQTFLPSQSINQTSS